MSDVRRLTVVWAVLSATTIATKWLGHASTDPADGARTLVVVAALAVAATKVQLIVWHFMEVRSAPSWLRTSTAVWLTVLMAGILGIYLW